MHKYEYNSSISLEYEDSEVVSSAKNCQYNHGLLSFLQDKHNPRNYWTKSIENYSKVTAAET